MGGSHNKKKKITDRVKCFLIGDQMVANRVYMDK